MTDINNNEQILYGTENELKAKMFDIIAFYQEIMKNYEDTILNGEDLTNSQFERDTWIEFHNLLTELIIDANSLMSRLNSLSEKAEQCMGIIQQKTGPEQVVKVGGDEALHDVTSVVSQSSEEKVPSNFEKNEISQGVNGVEDHEKEIGIIDKKIIPEVGGTAEEVAEVDDDSQKVIAESDHREVQEEPVAEVAAPVEETTVVDNGPQKVIIIPDERKVGGETEVSKLTEDNSIGSENAPGKVIIIPDEREVGGETEVSKLAEDNSIGSENAPGKVIIIPDERGGAAGVTTSVEMTSDDANVNPTNTTNQNEVSQGEVAETTSLANDIVIQENPEVSVPVVSAVPEISEPVVEQPVQSVVAEQHDVEGNSMMPSFSEVPVVNDEVVTPSSELTTVPDSSTIVSSQPKSPKVFAISAGYKGNPLSVNPTQALNLRNSKVEQRAKIISIIPYLRIGENVPIEAPQVVVANTVPMTEMPPMSESDYTNVSEEQLADMVNRVSVLYNEGRYEEAEALSKKVSELSKRYSAQGEKVLGKTYPNQIVA